MPNFYERRKRIAHYLMRRLGDGVVVVTGPDHPLLMRGPDILVGSTGGIVGFFLPTMREMASPELLIDRLGLSRIAYPPHARFVLLWPNAAGAQVTKPFDASFGEKDLSSVEKLSRAPNELEQKCNGYGGRSEAMSKFGAIYSLSLKALSRSKPRSERPTMASMRTREVVHELERVWFTSGAPTSASLNELIRQGARRSYRLSGGVPVPTNEAAGILIVDDWPIGRGDPHHRIRSVALAGWAMIGKDDPQSVDEFGAHLRRAAGAHV